MNQPVYEMLWDCRFCGQRKLLGLTHRHCPNCGAQQDASARYFPPDSEKVAVQDHVYFGADIVCRYCGNATSRRCKHCGTCGAPLAEGSAVAQRPDQASGQQVFVPQAPGQALGAPPAFGQAPTFVPGGFAVAAAPAPVAPPGVVPGAPSGVPLPVTGGVALPAAPAPAKKKSYVAWFVGISAALVVGIGVLLALVFWTKEGAFTVTAHSWKRTIAIDTFGPVRDSSWCDGMPAGATNVSRHREQRSTRQVPDGQTCSSHKVDNGDGTFHERQDCRPKYRSEAVYDDKCDYTIERWHLARTELAQGSGTTGVHWPTFKLAQTGSCVGCEREGVHGETYSVAFKDGDGAGYSCDFPQPHWSELADGSHWTGDVRRLTDTLDCDSLHK